MSDFETEVYMNDGVLVEIHRGAHCTVVRQFGEDWNGPVCSKLHAAAFEELRPGPRPLTADEIVRRAEAEKKKIANFARAMIVESLFWIAVGLLIWRFH